MSNRLLHLSILGRDDDDLFNSEDRSHCMRTYYDIHVGLHLECSISFLVSMSAYSRSLMQARSFIKISQVKLKLTLISLNYGSFERQTG